MTQIYGLGDVDHQSKPGNGHIAQFTDEEAKELFDQRARYYLKISGEEFIRKWNCGDYDDDPDRPEVMAVAMLLPLARG